ncbi:MAG: hypothetical protein ACFS26_00185 [Candidatus Karelsulcia muelleri]
MATMDLIKLTGANPANFFYLGGQADLISRCDIVAKVKLIFINLFGRNFQIF